MTLAKLYPESISEHKKLMTQRSMRKLLCVMLLCLLPVGALFAQLPSPESSRSDLDLKLNCVADPAKPECISQQFSKRPSRARPQPLPVDNAAQQTSVLQQGVPGVPEPPSEFQRFVEDSVGAPVEIFGYELFKDVPSTFAPADRIPVTADYVIGPGDELIIRAWGQIEFETRVVVDRTGAVYLPQVGSIVVAGMQYRQLPDHLKREVGRVFRDFDLTVTMGQLRSISVLVVGKARRPGAYTISALSTLVNAIFASGGPSTHGSMRHIQLKRSGGVVSEFDLYDLLVRGDKSKDTVLLPGDVIYVPPVGPQIAVVGSVNAPAIYELASATTLKDQLDTAGGLSNVADGATVSVERIVDRAVRKIAEFSLDEQGLTRELRDGDIVRVFAISPKFDNAVTIRGNVARPGRYPWREGMRVRDLIPSRDFLLTREYWVQQNNAPRRNGGESVTSIRNDVKMTIPEINWEYAVIQRLDPKTLETKLIPFNLGKAIVERVESENVSLLPGDTVTIFSQGDIAVSIEKQSKFVRVEGEVRAPGIYRVEAGETLRDVVKRAGGLTDHAYLFATSLTRESVRQDQQRSLDEMVRSLELEVQRKAVTASAGAPEEEASRLVQVQAAQTLVEKLRNAKATGRVILEIQPTDASVSELPALPLEDGDRVVIPFHSSTVTVVGAVYNQSSFVFKDGTSLKRYLGLAGNGTRDADTKHMFVVRADGTVVSREQTSGVWGGGFESLKVLPGDLIVVPTQIEKGSFMRSLKDWSQVIGQFGLGAAAVYVLTK